MTAALALHRVDLNLLVAFDVLADESSVTRAAERLGVTQSAMSHTLRRLRALYDDPLLVRAGARMELTPRAAALVAPVRAALEASRQALVDPAPFDPATSRRTYRMAGPDLVELLFLGELVDAFGEGAGLSLTALPPDRGTPDALAAGDVDVAITARMLTDSQPEPGPGLMRRTLLRDDWSCFVRASHPALGKRKRLSLAAYLRYPHAIVSPTGRGEGVVDQVLARRGKSRQIALRVASFYSAPVAIADSDLLLTAPSALGRMLAHLGLVRLTPPLDLPGHAVDAVWHQRLHADDGHRWFRERLAEVADHVGRRRR